MKKILSKICVLLLAAGLTACGGEQGNTDGNSNQPAVNVNQPGDTAASQPSRQHTLEEPGATIEAAGEFWNDWWWRRGAFSWEHIDESRRNFRPFDETAAPAHHPVSRGFDALLPSSGFANINDIGTHLLQFYTQDWVDSGQFGETPVIAEFMPGESFFIFGWDNVIEEYDGGLYIFTFNEGSARPNWATAVHTLVEQDGSRAIVETVVTTYDGVNDSETTGRTTIIYRFTLIDGRIDSGYGQWIPSDTPSEPIPWVGFSATLGDITIFVHLREHIIIENLDRLHSVEHFGFSEHGDTIFFEATEAIYDVKLIQFSNDWDENTEEIIYILADSIHIADSVWSDEGILIHGYMSMGTLPWSGISFYTTTREPKQRYFFAINHDNSDSHHAFMIWNITSQMRFE